MEMKTIIILISLKKEFNLKIIKSIGIKIRMILKKFMISNHQIIFYLTINQKLMNYLEEMQKNLTGHYFKNIKINKPWFISGGINIDNIEEINKLLIPYGIDISSGVEDKTRN